MSIKDLIALSGVPVLDLSINILTTTYSNLENIKVYKQQCIDMSARCVNLMVSLSSRLASLEATKSIELADDVLTIVRRIDRKVNEWATFNRLKSFLQQREIKDGIDRLHRDMDSTMTKFNIQISMEPHRDYQESRTIQKRDEAEMRDVLYEIIKSADDMKILLTTQSPQSIDEIMESLQTELYSPDLQPNQERCFKEGLWILHETTSKLPPLTDLTGQITISRDYTATKGSLIDISLGKWLEHEPVTLHLPRALPKNFDAQKRFHREVTIWRTLNHPNVVPIYGIVHIDGNVYSVSPWIENKTGIDYVQTNSAADRLRVLNEVASGLEYLHLQGIVHGNLRGANILISKDGVARLSDFGLSKFLEDCGQCMASSTGINARWSAPELLRRTDPPSTHSDVWSFAMVCLELMTGERPFNAISRDVIVILELDQGKIPERPGRQITAQGLTDELWSLMRKCWHKKPQSRPSMNFVTEKLVQMRELSLFPGPLSSPKRRPMFSFRRPSNGENEPRISLNNPGHRQPLYISHFEDCTEEKVGQPCPISSDLGRHSSSSDDSGNSRHKSAKIDSRQLLGQGNDVIFNQGTNLDIPSTSNSLLPHSRMSFSQKFSPKDSYMSARSVISSDSDTQLSSELHAAITDPMSIINFDRSGSVSSGTLEGLIERLINHFNLQKDLEYRDALFTGCTDFITSEDLFSILARKFNDAEKSDVEYSRNKVTMQYNIFMVMTYWLTSRHLFVNSQLLWQMRNFCIIARSMKHSSTLHEKAVDLLRLIDDYLSREGNNSSIPLLPGRKIPRTSEVLPRDLAIALTLLEGDKYKCILPTDYIAHLRRQRGSNHVEAAYLTNNKIVLWVKQSVLHYDAIESRVQVLKFFINTAQECRKFRNFASLTAIAHALHSAPIDRLKLTKRELLLPLRNVLEELDDILDPSANHRTYRAALHDVVEDEYRNLCVPWIAVHLRELHSTLQKYPTVVKVDNHYLINFERYIKFTDRIKEVLHYTAPDMEEYRQQGQLAYLEQQLRGVHLTPNIDEELMKRSLELEVGETRDYRARRRELRRLGFKTV